MRIEMQNPFLAYWRDQVRQYDDNKIVRNVVTWYGFSPPGSDEQLDDMEAEFFALMEVVKQRGLQQKLRAEYNRRMTPPEPPEDMFDAMCAEWRATILHYTDKQVIDAYVYAHAISLPASDSEREYRVAEVVELKDAIGCRGIQEWAHRELAAHGYATYTSNTSDEIPF